MSDRIDWVTDSERFASLAEPWDRLAATEPTPFLAHGWFSAWCRGFGGGRRLRVCTLWRGSELVGAFPLWTRRHRVEAMASTLHTPIFRPLGRDQPALRTLVGAVMDAAGGELSVEAIPAGDRVLGILRSESQARGRVALLEPQHTSPIVETAGDFSSYREAMKTRWRELERRRRKMEREHDVRYDALVVPRDLEGELARGFRVEASGWKGRAGTAIVSSPDTLAFYRGVAQEFHASGELRLSGLWLDGRLAAFDLSLLSRRRAYLLKTGYDESLRRLAPGLVLRLAVIERCFELGLEAYELLGDDMAWKRLFATAERGHVRLASFGRHPVPLARYAERRGVPALRRLYVRHVKPRLRERS
jgi:CelD/BcsL family acetyltransferase involved in cellulose biosynthesis